MGSEIRVLIVEDDQDLRESVVEYLDLAGFMSCGVNSAAEFYTVLAKGNYDVAVVDIGLPDQSGYVLVEYIRNNTDMKAIILTARDALDDRVKGYDCGADIYLVKPVDSRELAAAISSLAQRSSVRTIDSSQPSFVETWTLSQGAWSLISPDGTSIPLTGKELKFLELLAVTPGKSVNRDLLLTTLYLRHDEYTSRSLDSLVRRLRAKITASTVVAAPIKTAHAVGYCFSASLRMVM